MGERIAVKRLGRWESRAFQLGWVVWDGGVFGWVDLPLCLQRWRRDAGVGSEEGDCLGVAVQSGHADGVVGVGGRVDAMVGKEKGNSLGAARGVGSGEGSERRSPGPGVGT